MTQGQSHSISTFLLFAFFGILSWTNTLAKPEIKQAIEFERNQGQYQSNIAFTGKAINYQVALYSEGLVAVSPQLPESTVDGTIYFDFSAIGQISDFTGLEETPHKINYIQGERSNWHTNVANFRKVKMDLELPDIDVVFYDNNQRLEYDFVVAPQANTDKIWVSLSGIDSLELDDRGQLIINKNGHQYVQHQPKAYQLDDLGNQHNVSIKYITNTNSFGFKVAPYNQQRELIIDPVIEYSTYLPGNGADSSYVVDTDGNDNIYQLSVTSSPNLHTPSAAQSNTTKIRRLTEKTVTCVPCIDNRIVRPIMVGDPHSLLVTKFSADGKTKIFSTYLSSPSGGILNQLMNYNMKVNDAGEIALSADRVTVSDLPMVNPVASFLEPNSNGYVAKLNPTGENLVFATYLPLSGENGFHGYIWGIDINSQGEIAFAGAVSNIENGPTGALEVNPIIGQSCVLSETGTDWFDGYLGVFNTIGQLSFASCLGGENKIEGSIIEEMREIKFANNGNLAVVGRTSYTDLPVVNGFQNTPSAGNSADLYLASINPDTSVIDWSSYYGPAATSHTFLGDSIKNFNTSNVIYPYDLLLDLNGDMIIVGQTNQNTHNSQDVFQTSLNYPAVFDPQMSDDNGSFADYFVMRVNQVNGVEWFTYLGGTSEEKFHPQAAIDAVGNVYIYGITYSSDYPLSDPIFNVAPGFKSGVLSKLTTQGALAFSTYFGNRDGLVSSNPGGIAINSLNQIILGGGSMTDDYPITNDGMAGDFGLDATLSILSQTDLIDNDSDGVPDSVDAFPMDSAEWQNTDGDSLGNNADIDDDNDTANDLVDRFPYDLNEMFDTDLDAVGDENDFMPQNENEVFDSDGDGQGDRADADADNDGISDLYDDFMLDPNEDWDLDNDGVGNVADTDEDGDGTEDLSDPDKYKVDIPIMTFEAFSPSGSTPEEHLLPYGFSQQPLADASWTVDSSQQYMGKNSLASLPIEDGQTSGIEYIGQLKEGSLSFYYKVDSELNQDFLTFSLDGQVLLDVSGDTGWTFFSVPVTGGIHTLSWMYQKDGAISAGEDAAYIDHISGVFTKPVDIKAFIIERESYITHTLPAGGIVDHHLVVSNSYSSATNFVEVELNLGTPAHVQNILVDCYSFTGNMGYSDFCENTPRPIGNQESFYVGLSNFENIVFSIESSLTEDEVSVEFGINARANDGVFDIDINNGSENKTYHIGIFGSGFE